MLGDNDAIATIPVKDLAVAEKFYRKTLGLKPLTTEEEGVSRFQSGESEVLVYASPYAGTNQATTATWVVDDVEELVRDLRSKGVTFEHYDLPGLTLKDDVHVAGDFRAAWFKDPDGNILHIVGH
ncbi:MAG TPA: VOC family protein [Gemmatimonadales bacterium]|jgi:catechol 2,3-dioxygenase-like lactoylglutathione lyase family enzyme|nr:VOC family protein [Gemmatimonadales bacterium]